MFQLPTKNKHHIFFHALTVFLKIQQNRDFYKLNVAHSPLFLQLNPMNYGTNKNLQKMKAMGFTAMAHTTFQLFIPSVYPQK